MDEQPGLSEQYRMASPWPLFVALGIPISEVGILFDLLPVAVAGLVLFGGSVAGMATEAGYAKTPWNALAVLGAILLVGGGALVFADATLLTRGYAVIGSAVLLFVAAAVGRLYVPADRTPV